MKKDLSPRSRISGLAGAIQRIQQDQGLADPRPAETSDPAPASGQTFLIAGLGNPGAEYKNTRHNIGFMLLDRLAEKLGAQFTRVQNQALVTDAHHAGHKLILVKPQTYMNLSGQAVAALMRFYKVPTKNLLVVYDDMDIPLGTIRIRPQGGAGGQKGMQSIIERLGNQQNFPRLRLGLDRPPGQMPPPAYLLQDFSPGERERLDPLLDSAVQAVLTCVTEGLHKAMNLYNGEIDK